MKSILMSDKLHKELKLYAVQHDTSILKIVENAVGNLISQKASKIDYKSEDMNLKPILERKDSRINAFSDPPEPVNFNPVPKPK